MEFYDKIILNVELVRIWTRDIVAYFNAVFQRFARIKVKFEIKLLAILLYNT